MAADIYQIKSIIERYIKIVKQNNIAVEKIFLYGSHARGNATNDSDIDIAIISNDFTGERFDDRRLLVRLRRQIDRRIEPMPFRSDEFNLGDPLAVEIIQNGIELDIN